MSTPGVDAVYIGPADLAYALGLQPTGDNNEPLHVETVTRIFETAKKHGVGAGIHTGSVEYTKRYLEQGFHMVTLGQDSGFMTRLARKELAQVRSATGAEKIDPKGNFY